MGVEVTGCKKKFFCQGAGVQEAFSGGGGNPGLRGQGAKPFFQFDPFFKN